MLRWLFLCSVALVAACASDEDADPAQSCVPGEQRSCACPGGLTGVQVCQNNGGFGTCKNCSPAGGGGGGSAGAGAVWGGGGASGSSSGGAGGAGGTGATSGGGTGAGGSGGATGGGGSGGTGGSSIYVIEDCYTDTPRNGSEDCDDSGINVPQNPPLAVLVCINDKGGVVYLAKNTGPAVAPDPVQRCSGWELNGQKAADHLDYIAKLTCDQLQKTLVVDLTPYAGQHIYLGAHAQPDGSGHGTIACVQPKK